MRFLTFRLGSVCGIKFGESTMLIDLPHNLFWDGMCVQDDEAGVGGITS